ncbi:hypothetical protein CMK12_05640 [Candidatus Poribacteria bacterium]|nr:hypothetical protein [Candidatus Poribacteria bacterium]
MSDHKDSKATYTPNLDYHGEDSFTYKVNDGELDSEIAIITLQIEKNLDRNFPNSRSKFE